MYLGFHLLPLKSSAYVFPQRFLGRAILSQVTVDFHGLFSRARISTHDRARIRLVALGIIALSDTISQFNK
jgi:hypothetical protein